MVAVSCTERSARLCNITYLICNALHFESSSSCFLQEAGSTKYWKLYPAAAPVNWSEIY